MRATIEAGGSAVPILTSERSSAMVRITAGLVRVHAYTTVIGGLEHVAMTVGDVDQRGLDAPDDVLVRVHSECFTGDVLGSTRCDCGAQLDRALRDVVDRGNGVVVYLRGQEGRGIGLAAKLRAYVLQDDGMDTVDANLHQGLPVDDRNYAAAGEILADLGVRRVALLTNNPEKVDALVAAGVQVARREPLQITPGTDNLVYLQTKQDRMGHLLDLPAARIEVAGLDEPDLPAVGR